MVQTRGVDIKRYEPLMGVDNGQGFTKIGLILLEADQSDDKKGER